MRLCICELAIMIGCWIKKVVISSNLGGAACHGGSRIPLSVLAIPFVTLLKATCGLAIWDKKNNNNATNDQLQLPIADHRQCMPEI
ncbi:hypothetical protein Tco_1190531 [Tanacetum coccineum]